jgi:hypothetical protein
VVRVGSLMQQVHHEDGLPARLQARPHLWRGGIEEMDLYSMSNMEHTMRNFSTSSVCCELPSEMPLLKILLHARIAAMPGRVS